MGEQLYLEVYLQNEGPNQQMAIVRTVDGVLLDTGAGMGGYDSEFIYSNSFDNYVIRVLQDYQTSGGVTIEFAITAQFPDSDVQLQNNGVLTKNKNGQ